MFKSDGSKIAPVRGKQVLQYLVYMGLDLTKSRGQEWDKTAVTSEYKHAPKAHRLRLYRIYTLVAI